jgi:hypothetical protein
MVTLNLGKVATTYGGDYNNTSMYKINTIVKYSNLYFQSIQNNIIGVVPTTATHWIPISVKGDTGLQGVSFGGVSTTSLSVNTGSKTFSVNGVLGFTVGDYVLLKSGVNYMRGHITSLSITSGVTNITCNVSSDSECIGSGTFDNWSISPSFPSLSMQTLVGGSGFVTTSTQTLYLSNVNAMATSVDPVDKVVYFIVGSNRTAISVFSAQDGNIKYLTTIAANGRWYGASCSFLNGFLYISTYEENSSSSRTVMIKVDVATGLQTLYATAYDSNNTQTWLYPYGGCSFNDGDTVYATNRSGYGTFNTTSNTFAYTPTNSTVMITTTNGTSFSANEVPTSLLYAYVGYGGRVATSMGNGAKITVQTSTEDTQTVISPSGSYYLGVPSIGVATSPNVYFSYFTYSSQYLKVIKIVGSTITNHATIDLGDLQSTAWKMSACEYDGEYVHIFVVSENVMNAPTTPESDKCVNYYRIAG